MYNLMGKSNPAGTQVIAEADAHVVGGHDFNSYVEYECSLSFLERESRLSSTKAE